MTVKTSVSLTDAQEAFAREQVEKGRFASMSAVLQRGLDMLREETERHEAEIAALKALIDERRKGPFISMEEFQRQTEEMLAEEWARLGLDN